MTEHELLRIIAFLERVRLPFQELVPIAEEDATWNILLFLIKNHLTGTPVTISTLASVAKAARHGHAPHPRPGGSRRHRHETRRNRKALPAVARRSAVEELHPICAQD